MAQYVYLEKIFNLLTLFSLICDAIDAKTADRIIKKN